MVCAADCFVSTVSHIVSIALMVDADSVARLLYFVGFRMGHEKNNSNYQREAQSLDRKCYFLPLPPRSMFPNIFCLHDY